MVCWSVSISDRVLFLFSLSSKGVSCLRSSPCSRYLSRILFQSAIQIFLKQLHDSVSRPPNVLGIVSVSLSLSTSIYLSIWTYLIACVLPYPLISIMDLGGPAFQLFDPLNDHSSSAWTSGSLSLFWLWATCFVPSDSSDFEVCLQAWNRLEGTTIMVKTWTKMCLSDWRAGLATNADDRIRLHGDNLL